MNPDTSILPVDETNIRVLFSAPEPRGDAQILETLECIRLGPEARRVVQRGKHHLHLGAVVEELLPGVVVQSR